MAWRTRRLLVAIALVMLVLSGCRAPTWNLPVFAAPLKLPIDSSEARLAEIETVYAVAVNLESIDNSSCVDRYFETTQRSWDELRMNLGVSEPSHGRLWEIYHSSVAKTISMGQKYGRFDPLAGLEIETASGTELIPVSYHGFLWKPEDFNEFVLVGENESDHLPASFRSDGLGVPLVVKRIRDYDEPMRKRDQLFSATAVIRNQPNDRQAFSLELYNAGKVSMVELASGDVALARDLAAPFIYRLDTKGDVGFQAFRSIGSTANASGLYEITPYEPGKIPLIFVHGLLSDPTTWITMGAAILADPELNNKYQIWAFEYQTGSGFFGSAKTFRADLLESREVLDPDRTDPALDNIVIIGHSMGGLVSKLQISSSENKIWDSISNIPFDELVAPDEVSASLAALCFFEPNPAIKRVIFIGTPHRGATAAQRIAGKIASAIIKEPEQRRLEHQKLIADNPGTFSREVQNRIPTSIDLLEPKSQMLQAMQGLSIPSNVALHTILGDRQGKVGTPGDGVVPVSSARHSGVNSELWLNAKHTQLQSKPESIAEVSRILRLHQITEAPFDVLAVDVVPTAMNFSDESPGQSPVLVR